MKKRKVRQVERERDENERRELDWSFRVFGERDEMRYTSLRKRRIE